MRRYLVVANETLGGTRLVDELDSRHAKGPSQFVVVVPASIPKEGLTWTEGEARGLAQDRLDRVLQRLRDRGIEADGRIAGVDPYLAIENLLRDDQFDEVILSSSPAGLRSWKGNLLKRMRGVNIPVTHVPGEPEQLTRETALTGVPLFGDLPKRHVRALAKASMFHTYREGDVIIEEKSDGSDLFVILDGRVKVTRDGKTVDHMSAGAIFGEISLLDPGPRTASVIAAAPTRCLSLRGKEFRSEIARDPALAKHLLQAAGRRMRERPTPSVPDMV